MRRWTLKNGMRLVYMHRPTDSVALQVLVHVGSNDEPPQLRGVSHFIEHMVFEGTQKRQRARDISNEIEKVGGDINAYTSNERTCFYAKVLKKHFDSALDVLADILQRPLFRKEDVERQKDILFKEIDLVTDEPRFHQWVLFQQTLFKKHPCRYPTYGTRRTVKGTTAQDVRDHFSKYYFPGNMVFSVVGDVDNVKERIERAFTNKKGTAAKRKFTEPAQVSTRVKKERRHVANTYVVLGHQTVPRWHKDSYALDVIDGVLGRGQSGWMFDDIRNRHGLAYEVGTQHVAENDYGFFATYLSIDRNNVERVKNMILEQLERIQRISPEELSEAKTFIEGSFYLENEDTQKLADEVVIWEQIGNALEFKEYIKKIRSVTIEDVKRAAKKFFTKQYTMVVIEGD